MRQEVGLDERNSALAPRSRIRSWRPLMPRPHSIVAFLALSIALSTIVDDAGAVTLPSGFQKTTVFSGLNQPTAVQFASDGRVFVAEKSGIIKVFASLSATTPTIFADFRTPVHNYWDRGMLGLALHPNFP